MKKKGKSICIFSSKGGVGKSTVAVNLAGTFSRLGNKVLIIDLDSTGGAIGAMLNCPFQKNTYNFMEDHINNRYKSIRDYVVSYNELIDFIPSPKDPRQGARITPNIIELLIEKTIFEYDVVILDTNHYINEFNVTLLDKVDNILLVINNNLLDLKNTRNLLHIFKDIEKDNYKILLYGIYPHKKYYSLYEVKNIIKTNVNYTIDESFYIKSYDNYIADGKIIVLNNKFPKLCPKANKVFNLIAKELTEDNNEK